MHYLIIQTPTGTYAYITESLPVCVMLGQAFVHVGRVFCVTMGVAV